MSVKQRSMSEVAERLLGFTRNTLENINGSFWTRGFRLVDERLNPPLDLPPDPDRFVPHVQLSNDDIDFISDLTVYMLFWNLGDWRRLAALLNPHAVRLQRREVIERWLDLW